MTPTEILCNLIRCPSVNPMGGDEVGDIFYESRLSDWLEGFFASINAPHERIEVAPQRSNILAKFESPGSTQTILFDAHQDTVPVVGMTIDPFNPVEHDGKLYGRGACDVKGGMAAMLHAFARLHAERPADATNVIISCSCDEESTTLGVHDLVSYWGDCKGKSRLISDPPDVSIVAEPTGLDAVVAHLGVLRFRVHTHGRACHSSDPSRGENAIYKMARVIAGLQQIASELSVAVQSHPLCGPAAMSVGRIDGGTSVNIVPAHCTIEIDRRVAPGEQLGELRRQINEQILSLDPTATIDPPWVSSPALDDRDNHRIADRIMAITGQVAGPRRKVGVAYCTHAATIAESGPPAIVFGPGSIEQAHTQDEYIEVEQLDQAAEIYYRYCTNPL